MMSDRTTVVAVIGGGASGTLAAVYLLREAAAARVPLRIAMIDRNGRHGLGQAYATSNAAHLLNSRADRMSAVAGDAGHLVRWAAARGITRDGFLPRQAFGRYLSELLADAERSAGRACTGRCACTWQPTAASTPTLPCWPPATGRPPRPARCRTRPATSAIPGSPAPW